MYRKILKDWFCEDLKRMHLLKVLENLRLEDLMELKLRPSPLIREEKWGMFHGRAVEKKWKIFWPHLIIESWPQTQEESG